ncbi:MAG: radical SAM protein [Candidatus Marinimicrobia bacterium]|nr:radical SAM protein [Candidatus Neomarinimicrobiota bacterium]|tara:strand:- start:690 stop:2168 length:1479 start_codon:yes stop_codon:yes gene_type:complete
MKFAIIVPPVTCHNLDPHSGFPFIPHMAGYLASAISQKYKLQIIDAFSQNPHNLTKKKDLYFFGIDPNKIVDQIEEDVDGIFLYARTVIDYEAILSIIKEIKSKTQKPVFIFENSQCVDGISLKQVYEELLNIGADVVIFGEPENRLDQIIELFFNNNDINVQGIAHKLKNYIYKNLDTPYEKDLDKLNFPLWEKWPLSGYFSVNYAHPPIKKNDRFVTLITSRGCPFRCNFCVAPETNPIWRFRSPKNVVDEIEYFSKKLGINDFHISDLNPTIKIPRFEEICKEIIKRNLKITWKIAQGTKIETIKNKRTFDLFYKAGCRFLSFSPESGSENLMKKVINKPFNFNTGVSAVKAMKKIGIKSQSCFVIGMPGETDLDRNLSFKYMLKLAIYGVDEVACYIITPVPGSKLYGEIHGYKSISQLSHTPTWRKDIKKLLFFRYKFYISFILVKMLFHPISFIKMFYSIFSRNFETKMEMAFYKKFKFLKLSFLK